MTSEEDAMPAEEPARSAARPRTRPSKQRQADANPTDEDDAAPTDEPGNGPLGVERPPPGDLEENSTDDGDDPRPVAHELLAQAHAVLTIAVRDDVLRAWCPQELRPAVVETAGKVAVAVGAGHVEIASGRYDESLNEDGIEGVLARSKRRGLRVALQRLIEASGSQQAVKIRPG